MAIEVTRGPVSTNDRILSPYPVQLEPASGRLDWDVFAVTLRFQFDAGGQGRSDIHVNIPPEDFKRLAQAMMNADPESATQAFGAALVAGSQLIKDDPSEW